MKSIKYIAVLLLAAYGLSIRSDAQAIRMAHPVAASVASGLLTATYVSGISATGTGSCIVAFTGGGGTGAKGIVTVTSNTPGAITITNSGFGYTSTPTAATVSNGSLTCTGPAVVTSTIGTAPLSHLPWSWYETWNGPQAATALTGTLNSWANVTGTPASLVSSSTCGMNAYPWIATPSSHVLQIATGTGANNYMRSYIPTYLSTPASSQTLDMVMYFCLSSAIGTAGNTVSVMTIGQSASGLLGINYRNNAGSNVLYATSHANQTAFVGISTSTVYRVAVHLVALAGNSTLSIQSFNGTGWVDVTGSPASFTMEPSLSFSGTTILMGNSGGQTTFGATYEVGGIYITHSAFPNQINPPNLFISGAGTTAGNTVLITDMYAPGTAAQGYCSGNNATNGWANNVGNETWNSVYVIAPYKPFTVAGQLASSASPMMSIDNNLGTATGYVGCAFNAAPGQISAVGDWDFSIHYLGDGQQSMMRLTGNVSDYITTKVCLGVSTSCPAQNACGASPPTSGLSQAWCYDTSNVVWRCNNGPNACTTNGQWYTVGSKTGKYFLMSESESAATTTLANAIPNCCFYDHWYNISETVSPGYPHTVAVYDRGVGAWSPSTVYALNAVVADVATPCHVQQATTGGTSSTSKPTWSQSGGTAADGSVVWTDQGVCPAPVLLGITPGSAFPDTWPGTMTIGMSGEPTGLSDSYIANFVGDYSQGRTTTALNISTSICPNAKPGCPAASDLTLASGTTGTSARYSFWGSSGSNPNQSDLNRLINITGTISGSCNVGGGSHPGGAYMITSITSNVATFDGTVGTTGSVCSWAENTLIIGAM